MGRTSSRPPGRDQAPGHGVAPVPGWFRDRVLGELTGARRSLRDAREGMQELQDGIARAARRLEDVDWAQRGGDWPPGQDRRVLLSEFADLCGAAAAAGVRVGADLARAQERLVTARQVVAAWVPRTDPEREEQARLGHTVLGLHRVLEEARMDLDRSRAGLARSETAAAEALGSGTGEDPERVHADLLARALATATSEGHRVDAAVSRVSSQTRTAVRAGDDSARAARDRMRAHRDGSTRPPTPGGVGR